MNCAVHQDVTATGYCRNCGKPMCPQCTREVRGALYCEDCLAQRVAPAPGAAMPPLPPLASRHGDGHAALACALGFIPGLGAVYNGEYMKGLVHVLIFGGIIAALTQDLPTALYPILGVALAGFYFYMPIEAYRTARAQHAAAVGTMPYGSAPYGNYPYGAPAGTVASGATFDSAVTAGMTGAGLAGSAIPAGGHGVGGGVPPAYGKPNRRFNPIGAIVLIGLGILFLLGNFGVLRDDWVDKGWPLILIAIGVGLIIRKVTSDRDCS
jgi:TM2 domain-containing membrane protein YozV